MKDIVTAIKKARKEGKMVFVCGNGGSASNAEHLTNDLFSKGVKAMCLSSNTSIVTMIANDFGYKFIFSRQLEIFGNVGDLLITLSCSGTSENIVNAMSAAEAIGIDIYTFETAKDKTNIDYEGIEDRHLILAHKIKKEL